MQKFLGCLLLMLFLSLLGNAASTTTVMKNDPKRPVADVSKDLGVTAEQFVECFNNVNPTPGGDRPESIERVHANKKVLLSCLQEANPEITNDMLDAVMDRYRPGGKAAQKPKGM